MEYNRYYTTKEAVAWTGFSRQTLMTKMKQGKLHGEKFGKNLYFLMKDIKALKPQRILMGHAFDSLEEAKKNKHAGQMIVVALKKYFIMPKESKLDSWEGSIRG